MVAEEREQGREGEKEEKCSGRTQAYKKPRLPWWLLLPSPKFKLRNRTPTTGWLFPNTYFSGFCSPRFAGSFGFILPDRGRPHRLHFSCSGAAAAPSQRPDTSPCVSVCLWMCVCVCVSHAWLPSGITSALFESDLTCPAPAKERPSAGRDSI